MELSKVTLEFRDNRWLLIQEKLTWLILSCLYNFTRVRTPIVLYEKEILYPGGIYKQNGLIGIICLMLFDFLIG